MPDIDSHGILTSDVNSPNLDGPGYDRLDEDFGKRAQAVSEVFTEMRKSVISREREYANLISRTMEVSKVFDG